jgi:predicted nucleic-acid-binding protein
MIDEGLSNGAAFVDTSIIIRYLTQDIPEQAERARQIIDEHPQLLVTPVVIVEAAFVLLRNYHIAREAIVDALVALLRRDNIVVHQIDRDIVIQALWLCRPSGRVSFADAMLWASARSTGADSTIYTLDRQFPTHGVAVRTSR